MTHLYVLVTELGIERLELNENLGHKQLSEKVGVAGEACNIDFVYEQFSDDSIDIIIDDENLCKELPVICITPTKMQLRGQIVIAGCKEGATVGLTDEQFELIKKELILVKDKEWGLQIFHQKNIPVHVSTQSAAESN